MKEGIRHFFIEHYFCLTECLTEILYYLDLSVWQIYFPEINIASGKQLTAYIANDKVKTSKQKLESWTFMVSTTVTLTAL